VLQKSRDYSRILERLTEALASLSDSTLFLEETSAHQPDYSLAMIVLGHIAIPAAHCSPPAPIEMNRLELKCSAPGSNNTDINHG
jgi:hypothetical protein